MPINKFIGSKTKDKMLPNYHSLSRHMIYGLHLNFVFFLICAQKKVEIVYVYYVDGKCVLEECVILW